MENAKIQKLKYDIRTHTFGTLIHFQSQIGLWIQMICYYDALILHPIIDFFWGSAFATMYNDEDYNNTEVALRDNIFKDCLQVDYYSSRPYFCSLFSYLLVSSTKCILQLRVGVGKKKNFEEEIF